MSDLSPGMKFELALRERLRAEYQRGFDDGIRAAKRIRSRLTLVPDDTRQAQARAWADRVIAQAIAERDPSGGDGDED